MGFLRLLCTCEETCESVWPPKASLYASSTCGYLRLLASPFDQVFSYGSSFSAWIYEPRASRLGHTLMQKNSIRNLQYCPQTRLVTGISYLSLPIGIARCLPSLVFFTPAIYQGFLTKLARKRWLHISSNNNNTPLFALYIHTLIPIYKEKR